MGAAPCHLNAVKLDASRCTGYKILPLQPPWKSYTYDYEHYGTRLEDEGCDMMRMVVVMTAIKPEYVTWARWPTYCGCGIAVSPAEYDRKYNRPPGYSDT